MITFFIYGSTYILFLFIFIFFARHIKLYDKPCIRNLHKSPILNISGLALCIYLAFIIYFNAPVFDTISDLRQIITVGFFAALVGFVDDRINLSPTIKTFFLFFPCMYLILNGIKLHDIGNYEIIGTLGLGNFSTIFSFLAVYMLINSINYIDGIDGLLLSISSVIIGFLSLYIHDGSTKFILNIILLILIINLLFNMFRANFFLKTFSGNTGSIFIGFLIAFLTIYMHLKELMHPALIIWLVWFPVYDFIFVTINRFKNNFLITKADNSHFHHYLLSNFNNSHLRVLIIINLLNIIVIILGNLIFFYLGKLISLILFILFFVIYFRMRINFNKV